MGATGMFSGPAHHTQRGQIITGIQEIMKDVKRPHGGRRENAGRPKGAKNKATRARELAANNAIDETLAKLTQEEIQRFTPLEIMIMAMHLLLQSGNLLGAVGVAEKAAPYVHSKLSSLVPAPVLPEDLEPDPIPEGDEPGPEHPIL
jgi:hypothetical protein